VMGEMKNFVNSQLADLKAILTPEQLEKYIKMQLQPRAGGFPRN
jgi:hypothetical protein